MSKPPNVIARVLLRLLDFLLGRAEKHLNDPPERVILPPPINLRQRQREAERRCRGCGAPLRAENTNIADGCPCNSPRGVNHGIVPDCACTCVVCDPAQTGSSRCRPITAKHRRPT